MFGGVAGYRPRVRSVYYERIYVHSPRRNTQDIGEYRGDLKWGCFIFLFAVAVFCLQQKQAAQKGGQPPPVLSTGTPGIFGAK